MSEKMSTRLANKKNLTIISLVVIGILLITFDPFGLRSIIQPNAPENGVGYGYTRFYDPIRNEYYNGTYDLVKVSNTTEFFARGVTSDEVVLTDEPCYIVFNGSSAETNDGYTYFPFSSGFETIEESASPYENTIFLKRTSTDEDVNASIYWKDGVYGDYDSADLSNLEDTEIKIQITNQNLSNYLGQFIWLPESMVSQESADMNVTGWGFWLAFIGTSEPPINVTSISVDGSLRPVETVDDIVSVMYLTVEHATSYQQSIYLNSTSNIDSIVLYYGEIVDYNNLERILEVI